MATPPRKWPHNALWALEDSNALLHDAETLVREAQGLISDGHALEAVIALADVRAKLVDARRTLEKGKNGER